MKASECKCVICGAQAVAFWPVMDPDIPSLPYCRKCLDKEKMKLMISIFGEEKGKDLYNACEEIRKNKNFNNKTKTKKT